jgi:hypothetical protein
LGYFLAASAPVAQLDRALASGAKGCGFDPLRAYFSVISDRKVQCY